jgi:hypothetical protein
MTFEEMLDQALAMLQRRGRVTSRALTLQLMLDDEGRGLIWTGANVSDLASAAVTHRASVLPRQASARA